MHLPGLFWSLFILKFWQTIPVFITSCIYDLMLSFHFELYSAPGNVRVFKSIYAGRIECMDYVEVHTEL